MAPLRKATLYGIMPIITAMSTVAFAWDGIKSGKVIGIDATSGQNYAFRVYLDDAPMCGTSANWAYMNKDYSNYDATAALLTSAYLTGKPVIVMTERVGTYCQIGYVAFR